MFLTPLFKLMAEKQASDLFISAGAPVSIKIVGNIMPVNATVIDPETSRKIAYEIMTDKQIKEFEETMEMNFSYVVPDTGRFRVNVFRQRGNVAMVVRFLRSGTPGIDKLKLPAVLKDLVMEKRGFVVVVGSTGSGKSTTLAAMIEHRNALRPGHILTIEDPMEFVFRNDKCVINQREVGTDTRSYENALVNAMREAPDMMMIGEIRDRQTLQHALLYAQTGHLCISTLHANNSYHALNRIINFFPYEARTSLLSDLAISLKAIISQRLVKANDGTLIAAVEVMLNTKHVAELIKKGEIDQIKDAMEQSLSPGSETFEQALFKLYMSGAVSKDEALKNSDSATNLSWLINNFEQKASGKLGESPTGRVIAKPGGGYSFSEIKLNVDTEKK
ncbi:MAG TPA: PilT/PilU family type 4a pilus ATPase [Burkholderiales bacterium]|jgi:twitching motility protein PilU|nr:PilT/PilU family type 4a pilus ATPase [Burkholderiales bacterium]